jgi:phage terminase small subunit
MAALLSDRHRAFVLALYQVKPGYGAHVKAAKLAGFGTSTSSAKSWSVIASRLAHDSAIQAALHEEDQRRIRAAAPRAVRALAGLIEDPGHRDHARGIAMVLDRVHPVEVRHHVDHQHQHDHHHRHSLTADEITARILALAAKVGVDVAKLPPTIDAVAVEVPA